MLINTDDFKKGAELYEGYKSNIAMAFKDRLYWYRKNTGKKYLNNHDIHIVANQAASDFIELLCR
jgi:hypothetical protein